jgi:hypothetical protein
MSTTRSHVMRIRAYPADAWSDSRHLLRRPPLAEFLKAPKLDDLEIRILNVALIVQEDVYLRVAFEAGYRVYCDLFLFLVIHFVLFVFVWATSVSVCGPFRQLKRVDGLFWRGLPVG